MRRGVAAGVLLAEESSSFVGEILDDLLERILVREVVDLEIIDEVVGGGIANPLIFYHILVLEWRQGNVTVRF